MKSIGIITGVLLALVGAYTATNWTPDLPLEELVQRWALPPSTFLEAGGMQVHLRDEGPREDSLPIVLLHGTSASLHTWDGWAQALSPHRRVIRFDLPGFGLTGPAPDHRYGISDYVRLVTRVLDRLGVSRCVLAGNSLGGYVAWATALAQPDRIARLVLVDSAGYDFKSDSVPLAFRLARIPGLSWMVEHITPRRVVDASVRNVYGDPARVTDELVDRYYQLALRAGNRPALVQRFRQMEPGALASRIPELRLPTLILWGGKDRLIPPEIGRRFSRDIAGSQLVMFDELGHVPQEENPARTVTAIWSFLALP